MASRSVRLTGGPCDGLCPRSLPNDPPPGRWAAITVVDEDARVEHIYDFAGEHPPGGAERAVALFRYRGSVASKPR